MIPSKTKTLDEVLRDGDTTRFRSLADCVKVETIARERPGDLTDDEIKLLGEYERHFAEAAFEARAKAQAFAAAPPPTPAPTSEPSIQIARWLKGETQEEFSKRCRTHVVPLWLLNAAVDVLDHAMAEQLTAMNQKNGERNVRLTNLETRTAAAEAPLGGHNGAVLDERLPAIERGIAELRSQQALDGERIKSVEARPPALVYQGVFVPGKTYERGHVATWGGSLWHANEKTTAKPGDGSKAWTLCVQKGSDGRSAA